MNHKPWHWRKKSMEKTIFAADKVVSPSQIIEKEVLSALFHTFLNYTFSYYSCFVETRNLLSHYSWLSFDNLLINYNSLFRNV